MLYRDIGAGIRSTPRTRLLIVVLIATLASSIWASLSLGGVVYLS